MFLVSSLALKICKVLVTYCLYDSSPGNAQRLLLANSLKEKLQPSRLERYGYKIYSQNEEDGIIQEIFNRIGIKHHSFVEFGVEGGKECNTLALLMNGWHGLWIEGSHKNCAKANKRLRHFIDSNELSIKEAFITKENINSLISEYVSGEIDLLSIDIDGNDYYVLKEIQTVQPRVIVCEYNAKFRPPIRWTIPYDPKHVWNGSENQGMSLSLANELLTSKGYSLVATGLEGSNAFFVRNDLLTSNGSELFPYPHTPECLYNPARYYLLCNPSGHPVDKVIYPSQNS